MALFRYNKRAWPDKTRLVLKPGAPTHVGELSESKVLPSLTKLENKIESLKKSNIQTSSITLQTLAKQ